MRARRGVVRLAVVIAALSLAVGGTPASGAEIGSSVASAAEPSPSGPVPRIAGADRYATAAALSASSFAPGVPIAYVATGEDFPDALAGGAAAGAQRGPVLLTLPDALPTSVRSELTRLKPAKIVVLGGDDRVGDAVMGALTSYTTGPVSRIAGPDRYATSAAVSASAFAAGVPIAYIATGSDFPDALSGGAAAGAQRGPVLLTAFDTLPSSVRGELTRLKPARIVVLGGGDRVSDTVRNQLTSYTTGSVSRIAGGDRYATAAALSASAFAPGVPIAYVATGTGFPDALAGGAAAGAQRGPVLLTAPDTLPASVRAELARLKPAKIVVLGRGDRVGDAVRIQLSAYANGSSSTSDGWFTYAIYPDTQQEVFAWAGSRFIDRSKWLVAHRSALDLRFVSHTGDVVNWDTDDHAQYVIARAATDPLNQAGIPYQLSIGNHDTLATGVGGSARDAPRTYEYQRVTTTFNTFWRPSDYAALAGAFETGKVDNTYSVFDAEGARWLVLNLELWPRGAVVSWAESVIASHPGHNVIIQTHSYLSGDALIDGAGRSQTKWEYGDSSPQYIYDRLVAPYTNVKIVTSGHVGIAASRVVTTAKGNRVAYLLQTVHSNTNNPVRLNQIDVAAGTISTHLYAPQDHVTWDVRLLTGLSFIRG